MFRVAVRRRCGQGTAGTALIGDRGPLRYGLDDSMPTAHGALTLASDRWSWAGEVIGRGLRKLHADGARAHLVAQPLHIGCCPMGALKWQRDEEPGGQVL